MDESEKRKERLKAMRIEADQQPGGVNFDLQSSGFAASRGGLSNPLIENETGSTTQYTAPPRFDYYTDPMAAFSGRNRRNSNNNTAPQVSHGHSNTQRPVYPGSTPPPPYHNPPYQNPPYQNAPYQNPPYQNPPYQNRPYQNPPYHNPAINSPGPRTFQVSQPHYNQRPPWNPMEAARPPGIPPSGRGGNFPNPGFVQGDSSYNNYGRGRGGQRYNNNSYNDAGRGRGRSFGNNRSPGRGPSGGRGSRPHFSADERPDLYYRKEMLEDPWKGMTPIKGKGVKKAPVSDNDWLPKSISMKKAKISSESSSHLSISQQSLAEYLSVSFHEDIDDKRDNDEDDDNVHDSEEDNDNEHENYDIDANQDEDDNDKQENEDTDDKVDA